MKKTLFKAAALLLSLLLLLTAAGCAKKQGPAPSADPAGTSAPAAPSPSPSSQGVPAETPRPSAAASPSPSAQQEEPSPSPEAAPAEMPSPSSGGGSPAEEAPSPGRELDEDGYYYDVESVALYIDTYGKLPPNYITKKEAQSLGWSGGSVEKYRDGAAIGGDRFGNYEGLLPKAGDRSYTECDIDTDGAKSRGAKRLVFSNDGLFFYTDDHYESFRELTVTQSGEIEWK